MTTTNISAVNGSTSRPKSMVAPPTSNHSTGSNPSSWPRITERRVQIENPSAVPRAAMVASPLTRENRLKKGRTNNAANTKEPKGSKKMDQITAWLTIYSFRRISSATCSLPLGT